MVISESFSVSTVHQMLVYSMGMTLYWCVDYQLPQNQVFCSLPVSYLTLESLKLSIFALHTFCHLPVISQPVQLSAELEGLLLSMCEDMVVRRTDLLSVLETCELHHKALMLPPAERFIRQLVEDVYRNSVSEHWMGGLVIFGFALNDSTNFLLVSLSCTVISLQVDHVSMAENGSQLTDRSQMVRDRLHSKYKYF